MYRFPKTLALLAFAAVNSMLNADIKEMTPKLYKENRDWILEAGDEIDPDIYTRTLEMLMFTGAVDEEGNITDPEVVQAYAACVAKGACNWPTKMAEESDNITSPDQIFKIVRAAIGHKNLTAEQATEAAEKTKLWCDEINSNETDKHQLERAACSRLNGFYEEVARVQQNPTSEEALRYYSLLSRDNCQYQYFMAKNSATQQN